MRFLFLISWLILIIYNPNEANLKKNYAGKIGSHKIYMSLVFENKTVSGTYFYHTQGFDIKLTDVKYKNDQIVCFERDYLNRKTAKITGNIKNGKFSGIWRNLITQKELVIMLDETGLQIKPLSKRLTGNYYTDNGCKINVELSYAKGTYVYHLTTNKRKKSGKISISRTEDGNYIKFVGLPGDENQGDLEGLLSDNEIAIQNYGNSMNQYTRLSECGDKYIHLIKP